MREIILDTETTGIDPFSAPKNRIVEIGCIELIDNEATDNIYQQYINPERDMPKEAFHVHGLSEEFLSEQPVFKDIADEFLDFIGDSKLIIHNAKFDMKFLNAELEWLSKPILPMSQSIDTLAMARVKFPGAKVSLDALCKRFNIDNSKRTKHGALLDCELLTEVYLELIGGKQADFLNKNTSINDNAFKIKNLDQANKKIRQSRSYVLSLEEISLHKEFLEKIKNPLWNK